MKKFTLLSVLMLFAFVAFAQRGTLPKQMRALPAKANVLRNINGIDRKANMRKAPRKIVKLVTPPNEGEVWTVAEGTFVVYYNEQYGWVDYTNYVSETMNVCIDGNNIYIQGLASAYFPEGWVKGTISGNKVTIPCGQCVGEDDYGPEYIVGQPAGAQTGEEPGVDIVFDYDAAAGTLSLNESVEAILENGDPSDIRYCYGYWEGLVLTKGAEPAPELVTPPSEGEAYVMENSIAVEYDSDANDGEGGYVDVTEYVEEEFEVLIDGTDIYIKGIDTLYFPNGWIKGTLSDNKATFPSGQYVGTDEYGNEFIVGGDLETGEITDIVFDYDPETGTLTLDSGIVILITGKPKTTNFYYFWSTLTLVKKASDETPDAISTINAKQENGAIYNLQGVKMNKPTQKGVYIHNGRKVIVK